MRLDIKRNAKKGIVFGTVFNLVQIALPFVIQTIIIRKIGAEYAGIKGLFSSVLTVLSLADLGVGGAIVYSMYKPIANDDIKTINALFNTYKKIYRIIGLVIMAGGLIATPFLPFLIKGTSPEGMNIYIIFLMYLLNTCLSYWFLSYKSSLLSAYQRTDVVSKINIFILIFMNIGQITILILTNNYYLYLLITILFTALKNLVTAKIVDRMFPEIKPEGKISKELSKDIRIKVQGLFIGKICNATRNAFDSIFVSMFMGLTQAAIYSNYFFIMNSISGLIGIITTSLLAGIGNSIASNTVEDNYHTMMLLNKTYIVISGVLTACMVCLYQPFMSIWIGEKLMVDKYTMLLFPIYFYILRMGDVRNLYSGAAGLFWENRYKEIGEAACNMVLNYLLVKYLGIFGIVLATIITIFIFGFIIGANICFKYYFKEGKKEYFIQQAKYAVVMVIVSIISYYITNILIVNNTFVFLIMRFVICGLLIPLLYCVALLVLGDFNQIKRFIIVVLKKLNIIVLCK